MFLFPSYRSICLRRHRTRFRLQEVSTKRPRSRARGCTVSKERLCSPSTVKKTPVSMVIIEPCKEEEEGKRTHSTSLEERGYSQYHRASPFRRRYADIRHVCSRPRSSSGLRGPLVSHHGGRDRRLDGALGQR